MIRNIDVMSLEERVQCGVVRKCSTRTWGTHVLSSRNRIIPVGVVYKVVTLSRRTPQEHTSNTLPPCKRTPSSSSSLFNSCPAKKLLVSFVCVCNHAIKDVFMFFCREWGCLGERDHDNNNNGGGMSKRMKILELCFLSCRMSVVP